MKFFQKSSTFFFIVATLFGFIYLLLAVNPFGIKAGTYQAVFLTNGQVYFGKTVSSFGDFVKLDEVYYFQTSEQTEPVSEIQNQDLKLVKLGSEVHGPTNSMQISKANILFIEELADNSKVLQAMSK